MKGIKLKNIQIQLNNMVKAACLVVVVLTTSLLSADEYYTTDAKDIAENSRLQEKVAQENYFLGKLKEDLDVFQKDYVLANLGSIYFTKKEFRKAVKYLEMVGHSWELDKKSKVISPASFNLGMIYIHGKGDIPKNYVKAFKAFTRATWAGNIAASREVYVMCRDKEVDVEMIRAFTVENLEYYQQGVNHPLYESVVDNLRFLYMCESERIYLEPLLVD